MTSACPTCSHFDSLTGLPNRNFFLEHLDHVIAEARAQRFDVAVLAVNVDRLRTVNDSLGHRVGDKVLETVASRLQQGLREDDVVARSAGDEFLVLVPRLAWRARGAAGSATRSSSTTRRSVPSAPAVSPARKR